MAAEEPDTQRLKNTPKARAQAHRGLRVFPSVVFVVLAIIRVLNNSLVPPRRMSTKHLFLSTCIMHFRRSPG